MKRITQDANEWVNYLNFASRLYKYSFNNALLVYAQKPSATMVATMEQWNKETGRFLRTGSTGAAVFDNKAPGTLKYVFDVIDTVGNVESIPVQWSSKDSAFSVFENEMKDFTDIREYVAKRVYSLTEDASENLSDEFVRLIEDTPLKEYPLDGIVSVYLELVANSAMVMIGQRCNIDMNDYIDNQSINDIQYFNSLSIFSRLGSNITKISSTVLGDIEKEIKSIEDRVVNDIERSVENEYKHRITRKRWTLLSSNNRGDNGNREVRTDVDQLSARESSIKTRGTANVGRGDRKSNPIERGSVSGDGETSGRIFEEESIDGSRKHLYEFSGTPTNQRYGRGNSSEGYSLQGSLTKFDTPEIIEIRSEATHIEQTYKIDTPERYQLRDEVIDKALKLGSYNNGFGNGVDHNLIADLVIGAPGSGKTTIAYEFSNKNKSLIIDPDIIKEMLPEYNGGLGATTVHEESSILSKLVLAKAVESGMNVTITLVGANLEKIEKIKEVLGERGYNCRLHLNELDIDVCAARAVERFEKDGRFIDPDYILNTVGWNPSINYEILKEKGGFNYYGRYDNDVIKGELPRIIETIDHSIELESGRMEGLGGRLNTQGVTENTSNGIEQVSFFESLSRDSFLLDEREQAIRRDILNGPQYSDGKRRIFEYFSKIDNISERTTFLRDFYGTGGWHKGKRGEDGIKFGQIHNNKGISIEYDNANTGTELKIQLTWTEVAKKIDEYITTGDYYIMDPRIKASVLNQYYNINMNKDLAAVEDHNGYYRTFIKGETVAFVDDKGDRVNGIINNFRSDRDSNNIFANIYANEKRQEVSILDIQHLERREIELAKLTNAEANVIKGETIVLEGRHANVDYAGTVEKVEGKKATVHFNQAIRHDGSNETINRTEEVDVDRIKKDELKSKDKPVNKAELSNFKFNGQDLQSEGGVKTKARKNIEALKLLKDIEKEDRLASSDEQQILAQYVGWGGIPQIFDAKASGWDKEFEELRTLLNEDEYVSARSSTTNAHYTPPEVIEAIYGALDNLGFKGGNILEPAMGVGNFFGAIPKTLDKSNLYGVELDSVTGRIARQLYQKANIQVCGFENTTLPDNFFDVAIGNVPFGDYKLYDPKYEKHNFAIHDYFFAKTLDKVRPGGVVAFITSKYTMDKANPMVRKYIAEKAELLGAVRLPNTAFKEIAHTDVTTDIIFLQKRSSAVISNDSWLNVSNTSDAVPVNEYYLENPHMLLGRMEFDQRRKGMYGEESKVTCLTNDSPSFDLKSELKEALKNIKGAMTENDELHQEAADFIPADPNVRNYTFTLVENEVYYRENSQMRRIDVNGKTLERIKGMCEIRDITRSIIDLQILGAHESDVKGQQDALNHVYDNYVSKHGPLSGTMNARAFRDDNDYPLLCSLEFIDSENNVKKADMFSKMTIRPSVEIISTESARESLAVSMNQKGRVDLEYMLSLYPVTFEVMMKELTGLIYLNPEKYDSENVYRGWETADEYLSGNVRQKLQVAKMFNNENPMFNFNIESLESVQPEKLEAGDIEVRLGTTWIDIEDYEKFIYETIKTPGYMQRTDYSSRAEIKLNYNKIDASWFIENKSRADSIMSTETFGTKRKNAYEIIEDTLNLLASTVRDKVIDEYDKPKYVVNKKETIMAREKQTVLKQEFKEWLFKDPERRKKYVDFYNEKFNNIRLREYDGSHLTFPGMNPDIKLRKHQTDAIARTLYSGGNTLYAHCVGAGKSFVMVASAMEMKRIGLSNKSIMVVPNHLTEQMGAEFLRLYPSANILVSTKKDFEKTNRRRFVSRIATGEYDAIIMGHSQFEKIPISKERHEKMIRDEISQITWAIKTAKDENGENWSIKQMEGFKKNLEADLKSLNDQSKKDDVINFEELGIDAMYVDEAHYYKNCAIFTKMRNIAGIGNSRAKKSSDMLMKTQYLNEINDGRGVIFATGTPISNSMSEMFVMQRYLQSRDLEKIGIQHFDAWAANFGEVVSSLELAPEGTGYRFKNRFSKFVNLPELMTLFKQFADVQTPDMLNLPVPKLKEDKYVLVAAKPSDYVMKVMDSFVERAEAIRNRMVQPYEDNMLKITNEARLLGTDPRLLDPFAPDDPDSKVNQLIQNVFNEYRDSEAIKGTQIIFSDVGTPNSDGRFSVYDYIKTELLKKGIPEDEVCFIHDAKNETKREEIFSDLRSGNIRVILGSTPKMGTGTNIQDRLIALHHVDCPYRPADIEQREGRIIRQGNMNPEVNIYRYVTKDTFDSYLWQLIENKQKFISQVMTSKSMARNCEDLDDVVLSYAEVKALATGNPFIKEKMDVDNEVSRLMLLKMEYLNKTYKMQEQILTRIPNRMSEASLQIENISQDIERRSLNKSEEFCIMINGNKIDDKEEAGDLIRTHMTLLNENESRIIGSYRGFELEIKRKMYFDDEYKAVLKGNGSYEIELGKSASGNVTRLDNAIDKLDEKLNSQQLIVEELKRNLEDAKSELDRPFAYASLLTEKQSRQSELNALLDMSKDDQNDALIDENEGTESESIQEVEYEVDHSM